MMKPLAQKLRAAFAEHDRKILDQAIALATRLKTPLYLVGGPVRDCLLERPITDFDLTVEGDAIDLAQRLAKKLRGSIKTHDRFGTAKLVLETRSVDLATTRTETYAHPGALPNVTPGTLQTDLVRRDFTINALAIRLDGDHFGELIDLHHGAEDLKRGLVRVIHAQSFVDDPTRIFRAARFAARFNFEIEPETLTLIAAALPVIDQVSGDRLRHEFELIFREAQPASALTQLERWGVFKQLDPEFQFESETQLHFNAALDPFTGWVWLLRQLPTRAQLHLIKRLNLPAEDTGDLLQAYELQRQQGAIKDSSAPSVLYHLLNGYTDQALSTAAIIIDDERTQRKITHFIEDLRGVKIAIDGHRLQELGLTPGPAMRRVLAAIRTAVLDGQVVSPQQEAELAKILIEREQEGNKPGFAKKPWL
jgi:tRNA nucleotidyltransferase (CCA-adding enzyme)